MLCDRTVCQPKRHFGYFSCHEMALSNFFVRKLKWAELNTSLCALERISKAYIKAVPAHTKIGVNPKRRGNSRFLAKRAYFFVSGIQNIDFSYVFSPDEPESEGIFQLALKGNILEADYLLGKMAVSWQASLPCPPEGNSRFLAKRAYFLDNRIQNIDFSYIFLPDETESEGTFPKIKSKLDSGNLRTGLDKALWFEAVLENTPQLMEGIQRTFLGDIANSAFADLKWKINAKCQTFADLVKLLQKMLSAAESNTSTSNEASENNKRPKCMVNKITELICSFDGEAHLHKNCPLTVQERANIAKQKNLCVCCLKSGHSSDSCFRKRNCYVCQIPHNRALCPRSNNESSSSEVKQAHQCNHVSETRTCFKTLIAECEQKPVRCFFDEGSNCNFISSAQRRKLSIRSELHNLLLQQQSSANSLSTTVLP